MLHRCARVGNSPCPLDSFDVAATKLFDQMLAGPQRESQDADRGSFVCAIEEDAGVASVQVRHVMSLAESVGDEFLGIVAHTARAGVVGLQPGTFGESPMLSTTPPAA